MRSPDESGWETLEELSQEGWSIAVLPAPEHGQVRILAVPRLGWHAAGETIDETGPSVAELAPVVKRLARAA